MCAAFIPPCYNWLCFGKDDDWGLVGKMSVTVYGARGLHSIFGRPDSQCILELDDVMFKTDTIKDTNDPNWNKTFTFAVNDITSTLEIVVHDQSFIHIYVCLGKLSIPLLQVNNEQKRWYALKDGSKLANGKKRCPRILLQMTVMWNPIKASLRVMTPKAKKIETPPEFNIKLIYNNLKFITDVFHSVTNANEFYKKMFEWNSRVLSAVGLSLWIGFWLHFKVWVAPNLVLTAFFYHLMKQTGSNQLRADYTIDESVSIEDMKLKEEDDKTLILRLKELRDVTVTTKNGIDYIVALMERIKNLVMFRVPYLSYLAMLILLALSLAIYFIHINHLLVALGIFKFIRKRMNPNRVPNNDLLDFLSRVPNHKQLKQWQEIPLPRHLVNKEM